MPTESLLSKLAAVNCSTDLFRLYLLETMKKQTFFSMKKKPRNQKKKKMPPFPSHERYLTRTEEQVGLDIIPAAASIQRRRLIIQNNIGLTWSHLQSLRWNRLSLTQKILGLTSLISVRLPSYSRPKFCSDIFFFFSFDIKIKILFEIPLPCKVNFNFSKFS